MKTKRGGYLFYQKPISVHVLKEVLVPFLSQSTAKFLVKGGEGALYAYTNENTPFVDENNVPVTTVALKIEFNYNKAAMDKRMAAYLNIYAGSMASFQVQICPSVLFAGVVQEAERQQIFHAGLQGRETNIHEHHKAPYIPKGPIYITVMEPLREWVDNYDAATRYFHEEYLKTLTKATEVAGLELEPDEKILAQHYVTAKKLMSDALSLLFLMAVLGYAHGDPTLTNLMECESMSDQPFSQAVLIDFKSLILRKEAHLFAHELFKQVATVVDEGGFRKIKFDFTGQPEDVKTKLITLFLTNDNLGNSFDPKFSTQYMWIQEMGFDFNDLVCKNVNVEPHVYSEKDYVETTELDMRETQEMLSQAKTAAVKRAREEEEQRGRERLDEEIRKPPGHSWWQWVSGDYHDI